MTLLIILNIGVASAQDVTLKQIVRGTVYDEQSGSVLSNATVMIEGLYTTGVITDSLGNFKFRGVPIGRQTIRVTHTAYEEGVIQNIEVTSTKEVVLEIRLKERINVLDEVVVKAGKQKNRALNEAAVVSARQFSD